MLLCCLARSCLLTETYVSVKSLSRDISSQRQVLSRRSNMIAQMKIDRRAFIAGMGASMVLASMPSRDGDALAADPAPVDGGDPAYEPWATWRGEASDGPLALVRAAIVAATGTRSVCGRPVVVSRKG